MKSWDCFDTLIARRFVTPQSIFEEVGKRIGDSNFPQKRIEAKRKSAEKTYSDIYKYLKVDPQIELDVEMEHCFPIVRNMSQVSDGDYIISDMYLPGEFIGKMLLKCGLNKDVKVISTPAGKRDGWIWNTLPEKSILHTGDHPESDGTSPGKWGIPSKICHLHNLSKLEKTVEQYDPSLAAWMRYVRLHDPEGDNGFWQDTANLNLPILALASLELPVGDIFFTYRDCVYWKPLFEKITGRKSIKFQSSRQALYGKSGKFDEYVALLGMNKNSIIVDLYGTGKSLINYFGNTKKFIFLSKADVENGPAQFLNTGLLSNNILERLNTSTIGSVDSNFNQMNCEHNPQIAKIQSDAMNIAIESVNLFPIKKNKELMDILIKSLPGCYSDRNIQNLKNNKRKEIEFFQDEH